MFFDFLLQEWKLAAAWLVVAAVLWFYENSKDGKSVSPQQLSQLVNKQHGVVLDIRDKADFVKGHITDAYHIPFKDLDKRLVELNDHKDKPVIVVCKMGTSAGTATKQLKAQGFQQVFKLGGGISEWSATGLPLIK